MPATLPGSPSREAAVPPLSDEQIAQVVLEHVGDGVRATYLFGSYGRGEARADSDLDVGVLLDRPLDRQRRFDIEQRIAGALHRDVDLVDLAAAPAFLRGQVVAEGRRIHCTDALAAGLFEAHALADYARLHEELREVLAAFDERYREREALRCALPVGGGRHVPQLERCLARVRELTTDGATVLTDQTVEDAVVLNLQRACETCIDIAMRLVARHRAGLPQDSREAFTLLERAGLLPAEVADSMRRMVGFRNIAVHQYQDLDRAIVGDIATRRLGEFEALASAAMQVDEPAG